MQSNKLFRNYKPYKMHSKHEPIQQVPAISEQPSPLSNSSLPRRDFLRQLSAIVSSGSQISSLAAVIEQASPPASDITIEHFRPIKAALEQYLSSDIAIRKRLDPHKFFHLARGAIAK